MKGILKLIHESSYFNTNPHFVGLYYKLLYNRSLGDTRTCNNRSYIPPSRRVMRGVPLAEFHLGGVLPLGFHRFCSGDPDDNSDVPRDEYGVPLAEYDDAARWADSAYEPRAFYDAAYAECIF
jgi:hypothetical protein